MNAAVRLHPAPGATFETLKAGLDIRAGGRIVAALEDAFPSGFPALDQALSGGFARGTVATLEGPPSAGRTAVLARMLAEATRSGLAAVVHDGTLYPPGLEDAGVLLARMPVVAAGTPLQTARSADILLRAKTFALVAMPAVPLRATVWSRLCGLAQKSGTLLLVLALHPSTELGYFASTRVRCAIDRVVWSQHGVQGELSGYDMHAHVLKHKRAAPGATAQLHIGAA
ncbi:MAG: hypothetical protein ABR508_07905 [Candidatus Baltobacteraceae bacterium]